MILTASPSAKYEIIREMTSRDNNLLNIGWLCEIAGVSRSGYYYWLKNGSTSRIKKEYQDEADFTLILKAYKYRGYDKGVRGIHMRLLRESPPVIMNPKKIRRLMKKYNLHCPIRKANPYRRMRKAMMTNRVAPNLLNRTFRAHGPRAVLLTDITYIPRRKVVADGSDKFTYLCVIMDAYTKEVLAYTLSVSLEVDFVLATVNMLMEKHGGELKTDALIHSDQGCHYTSSKFIDIIGSSRLRQSMSRKGNCWDNAPQESLFGHMKADVKLNPSYGHAEIVRVIDDWVDYYNHDRYQWGLAKLAPCEFYRYITTGEYSLPFDPPPIVIPDGINLEGDDNVDFDEESDKPS